MTNEQLMFGVRFFVEEALRERQDAPVAEQISEAIGAAVMGLIRSGAIVAPRFTPFQERALWAAPRQVEAERPA